LKKLNLAKVRSAIGATIALVLVAVAAPAAAASVSTVHLVWVPASTTVEDLAAAGLSPGLMSAGLGTVPAQQTYLDVGQGNRVFDSLYDEPLPTLRRSPRGGLACWPWFPHVQRRAESAPADIEPGLLTPTLRGNGVSIFLWGESGCALGGFDEMGWGGIGGNMFEAIDLPLGRLERTLAKRKPDDLVIAIARPTGHPDDPLPIGIAGVGFDGDLTSDSTRMNGYVLSTDVAPTILEQFGIDVPSQMSGQPIHTEGSVDPVGIEDLGARMELISGRRGTVIGLSLLGWVLVLAGAILLSRGAASRIGVELLGLAVVYMPLTMLAGAALEPGEAVEALLVGLGAPLLGAITLALQRGYRALALASAATVLAYGVDVIAGSPLTTLSLLGPNPGLGVRFYGIGNELEALLVVLVLAGCGAALAGFLPRLSARRSAFAFLAAGLLAAFVFAAGRFGADVGAAIVFPVGAAVAAAAVAARRRRTALLAIAAPFAALALLAAVDLVSGANAHLTRSVLDAGGFGDLAQVAQRRLQLSAHSFVRPVLVVFLPLVAALAALAVARRDLLRAWVAGAPAMRAGLLGALAATLVGTLANDSGALLLVIGAAYLLVFAGFAWAESTTDAQTKSYTSVRHESHDPA
jgi:hypothetical protein